MRVEIGWKSGGSLIIEPPRLRRRGLHCRSWCRCSASSCCRPLGFRRLGARRVALVSLCRSGADACREVGHCGCEGAEPTTSFFVGSSMLAVRWRGA